MHVLEQEFDSGSEYVTSVCRFTYELWPLLQFAPAGGFIMFIIGRSEGDQSIIGDIPICSSPKHSC